MNRITTENVAAAIRKVSSLSLPQKEELAEQKKRRKVLRVDICTYTR